MYYFTALDPNFRIKGSRDPLGFQSIWSAKGRKVVAYLSTVSQNLRDFMILAYATHFHRNGDDRYFVNFFLKFEQACAFARKLYNEEDNFNGSIFVSKNMEDRKTNNAFPCSLSPRNTILSNQRAYGIYGKYIRPFRDTGIANDDFFHDIMEKALKKCDKNHLKSIIERLINEKAAVLSTSDLEVLARLISSPIPEERELYRNYLLNVPESDHPQNGLYRVLKNSNISGSEYHLYGFIHAVNDHPEVTEKLRNALKEIEHTEKVLYPLNRGFTYMLNTPHWNKADIDRDPVLDDIQTVAKEDLLTNDNLVHLVEIYRYDKQQKIQQIVGRNKYICEKRGYRAWIEQENGGYNVLYGENGKHIDSIDYMNGHEYPYFIPTYLNLFNQIERN